MFGRHLPLSEQALQVIEQIGEDMPGGFFIYKATGNEELSDLVKSSEFRVKS